MYEHKYTNPTPSYGHLQKTKPVDLEIHKVITGASLSTGTSSTAESIASLNPGINLGKYEHPCQIDDLNLGAQVPSQEPNQLIYDQSAIYS
jgi:hypothetical protein